MTIPTLSNCQHLSDGWCLGCVKALQDKLEATQLVLSEITEEHNCPHEYVRIGDTGPIYCLYGTSSISAFEALKDISVKRLAIAQQEIENLHKHIIKLSRLP